MSPKLPPFSKKSPIKFALKTGIEKLNEMRLLEGEAQDSTMSWPLSWPELMMSKKIVSQKGHKKKKECKKDEKR